MSRVGYVRIEVQVDDSQVQRLDAAVQHLASEMRSLMATNKSFQQTAMGINKETAQLAARVETLQKRLNGQTSTTSRLAAENKKLVRELESTRGATQQVSQAAKEGVTHTNSLNRSFKALSSTMARLWIVSQSVRHIGQMLIEGAQTADLRKVLEDGVSGFDRLMERTKAASGGMLSESQMLRSTALMRAFGIDVQQMDGIMGTLSKTAVVTGQSLDYMLDSFARGVARQSPLILDNLGIQISLKEVYDEYAASVGKSTEELTKHDRMVAVLNASLKRLEENTKGVSLSGLATPSTQRLVNFFDDRVQDLKEAVAGGVSDLLPTTLDEMMGAVKVRADDYRRSFDGLVGTYQNLHGAYGPIEGDLTSLGEAYAQIIEYYGILTERADQHKEALVQPVKSWVDQVNVLRKEAGEKLLPQFAKQFEQELAGQTTYLMRLLDEFTSRYEAVESGFRSMGLEIPDWWKEKKAAEIKAYFEPIVRGTAEFFAESLRGSAWFGLSEKMREVQVLRNMQMYDERKFFADRRIAEQETLHILQGKTAAESALIFLKERQSALLDDIQKKEKDTNEIYAARIFMQGMFAKMTGVDLDSLLAQTTADISRLEEVIKKAKEAAGKGTGGGRGKDRRHVPMWQAIFGTDFVGLRTQIESDIGYIFNLLDERTQGFQARYRGISLIRTEGLDTALSDLLNQIQGGSGLGIDQMREFFDKYDAVNKKLHEMGDDIGFHLTTKGSAEIDLMRQRIEMTQFWHDTLNATSDSLSRFNSLTSDMVAPEVTEGFGGLQSAISGIAAALKTQYDAMTLVEAALPGMEQFTKSLIKDQQTQALVLGLMEAAAAAASYATYNYPAGIAHTAAAVLYGLVAGKAFPAPPGAKSSKKKDSGAGGDSGGSKTINIHMGGSVLMTEAERGDSVRRMLDEARRHGFYE